MAPVLFCNMLIDCHNNDSWVKGVLRTTSIHAFKPLRMFASQPSRGCPLFSHGKNFLSYTKDKMSQNYTDITLFYKVNKI